METKLDRIRDDMLDTLSQFGGDCLLLISVEEGVCHWSSNSLSRLELGRQVERIAGLWEKLLHEEDREGFLAAYRELAGGVREELRGSYRMRCRGGDYRTQVCRLWRVEGENLSAAACLAGVVADPDRTGLVDPVTGLRGNHEFRDALAGRISRGEACSVLLIGIDNFKDLNELKSYAHGDLILRQITRSAGRLLPKGAALFRSDGDGFWGLFPQDEAAVRGWFSQLQDVLLRLPGRRAGEFGRTVSAGLSRYPEDGADLESVYSKAALALSAAKVQGKNRLVAYSGELACPKHRRSRLMHALRDSVARDFQGFSLCYQPIVHARDGTLAGCEALLRWRHPQFQNISPQEFIPCLEESGLIKEVGRWVLVHAVRQCKGWARDIPDFCMNINVSSQQFEAPNFQYQVVDVLNQYGVQPGNIVLELTESAMAEDAARLGEVFDFLRSQGVHIAFDDFGTGYASLDIFRRLSADELKIDQSFLERLAYDVTDQALIRTLISLCHSMNMLVCVEGIKDGELEELVRQMEPDYLQGYHFGHPMTCGEFERKYFNTQSAAVPELEQTAGPEHHSSMTYAPLRPVQPMRGEDIINYAFAGIFQVGMDQEFTFLTCNEGYRRMLGYTMPEMRERFRNRALGFVHPEDLEYVNDEIRRQLKEGDTVTIEFRVVRKDGTPIWILGTGNVYHSPEGGSNLVVVILNNDKNKREQLAWLEKYHIYEKLIKNLPTGVKIVRYDPEFTIEYISPGFLGLIGYSQEEITTKFEGKYINLIYQEDRASVMSSIMEQLKKSDVVTMRYRTPCKDGKLIWVETISRLCPPDGDGIQRACSSLVDISEIMGLYPEENSHGLKIANRYESAASQWGEFLFEYDLCTDVITSSENFNRLFRCAVQRPFSQALRLVHKEDHAALKGAVAQCRLGERPENLELRLHMPDGSDRWFSVAFSHPERLGNTPVNVLGRFTDIDEEKREHQRLLEEARRDSLTGLLNKGATEALVRARLGREGLGRQYAMFLLDVDRFKRINDSFGHFAGDEVLRQVAGALRRLFGEGDILGRVGGDEFMVFVAMEDAAESLSDRAENILNVLREVPAGGKSGRLSASIGVSCYPEDGRNFYDLFRRADSALYRAKGLGRGRYCLASQSIERKAVLV